MFQHDRLNRGYFRLFTLDLSGSGRVRGWLETVPINSGEGYKAVSYAWDDERPSVVIECNNQDALVTPTIHDFLRVMRAKGRPGPYWIDAVCISQADTVEKATQVRLMHDFFSRAFSVVFWLGPGNYFTDKAAANLSTVADMLENVGSSRLMVKELNKMGWSDIWKGREDLLSRRWFRRLWIVQEFMLAKNVEFYCGSSTVSIIDLCRVVRATEKLPYRTRKDLDAVQTTTLNHGFLELMDLKDNVPVLPDCPPPISLATLINFAMVQESSEPVDRVYALVGMMDLDTRYSIAIDYSEASRSAYWTVYCRLGQLLMALHPDLELLRYANSQNRHSNMPSWFPDLNYPRRLVADLPHDFCSAGGSYGDLANIRSAYIGGSKCGRTIYLRGCVLGQITTTSPPASEFLSASASSIEQCISSSKWVRACQTLIAGEEGKLSSTSKIKLARTLVADMQTIERSGDYFFAPAASELQLRNGFDSIAAGHKMQPQNYQVALRHYAIGRKFFVANTPSKWTTESSTLGIGPDNLESGDLIILCRAARLPFIIRPIQHREFEYHLLGEAYIHGYMDGQMWQRYCEYCEFHGTAGEERIFAIS